MKETTKKSIDTLADVIDVVVWLLMDKPLTTALLRGNRREAITLLIKDHKEDSISLICAFKGIKTEDYEANSYQIFSDLMEVLQSEGLNDFFTQWRNQVMTSSGSVGNNTEEKESSSSDGSKPSAKRKKKDK